MYIYLYLITLPYNNVLNIYDLIFIHMCSCNFCSLPVIGKETKHSSTRYGKVLWLRENPSRRSTDPPPPSPKTASPALWGDDLALFGNFIYSTRSVPCIVAAC
jgi:hypothetical protein